MALEKKSIHLNFAKGIQTKADPNQIPMDAFAAMNNSVFSVAGRLTKRNGFNRLAIHENTTTYLTTYRQNLIRLTTSACEEYVNSSIGFNTSSTNSSIASAALSSKVSTAAVIRTNSGQYSSDIAYATSGLGSGLSCVVFADSTNKSAYTFKYSILNSSGDILFSSYNSGALAFGTPNVSGGNITAPLPRVYFFSGKFVVLYYEVVTATTGNLKYFTIDPTAYTATPTPVTLRTDYGTSGSLPQGDFDAAIDTTSTRLYIAYPSSSTNVKTLYLDSSFSASSVTSTGSMVVSYLSVAVGHSADRVYVTGTDGATIAKTFALTLALAAGFSPVTKTFVTNDGGLTVTSFTDGNFCGIYSCGLVTVSSVTKYQNLGYYSIDSSGSASAITTVRGLGLASKPFTITSSLSTNTYILTYFGSFYQPTYFLLRVVAPGSVTPLIIGGLAAKIAYSNAPSSNASVVPIQSLPNVYVSGTTAKTTYLIADQLVPLSTTSTTASGGVFSLAGINSVSFDFSTGNISTEEIGNNLLISGGFITSYDGFQLAEQNFFVFPEQPYLTGASGAGGSLPADTYYYVAVYEWTDAQGNVFRSAPSIPSASNVTTGATSSVTVNVTTLKLTIKTTSVRIVLYRYSLTQPVYHQLTSITAPLLNDMTVDTVSYLDTLSNTSIAGNNILYTTGGIVEDISPPSSKILATYKSRLFLVDAEDPNLLWYSKQVIEGTPVEMSDLFTVFIPPNFGGQSDTGPITSLSTMDDKLIIFKSSAIYYLVGNGPDNTGFNNDFSDPVLITTTVGCTNQNSIVYTPNGLMFQTDKGIWLLGRDLSTSYIGAPAETYNSQTITSAFKIPNTTQVRFTYQGGTCLVYDYFYDQWQTFSNMPASSATIYQGLHTYLRYDADVLKNGIAMQETVGTYTDQTAFATATPVAMSFQTAWINLAGLQGYERAYFLYLLANYLSSHTITVGIAYDYNPSIVQTVTITPDSSNSVEQWRVFFKKQKCESFQLTITENISVAGAGFTLSGLNLVIGGKKTYPFIKAKASVG